MAVAFDPIPVRHGRRGPDPAALVAVLAIAFLGLAIAKPWSGGRVEASPAPSPSVVARASPSPSPASSSIRVDAVDWPTLMAAVVPHDAWGIELLSSPGGSTAVQGRTITLAGGQRLVDRWWPILALPDDPAPGGSASASRPPMQAPGGAVSTVLGNGPAPIRFLGVTSPAVEAAIDLRVWFVPEDGSAARWLDIRPLVGDLGLGEWILPPPLDGGTPLAQWPSGFFRIDALVGSGIRRMWFIIPPTTTRPTGAALVTAGPAPVNPLDSAPQPPDPGSGDGPEGFLEVQGTSIDLPSTLGPSLDESGAWLAATAGERPTVEPSVIDVYAPGTTGIGVRYPAQATALEATLVSLSGSPPRVIRGGIPMPAAVSGRLTTGTITGPTGEIPWAQVDLAGGGTLLPGDYRLDVAWRDGVGRLHRASLHVGLLPGPRSSTPAFLTAIRGMARYAGDSGIVTRIPGRIEGVGADAFVQLLPEPPGLPPDPIDTLGTTCDGAAMVDASQSLLGIAHPARQEVRTATLERLFVDGRAIAIAVRTVIDPLPGLTLIAPALRAWAPGWYRVTLTGPTGADAYPLCIAPVGEPPHVPADAGSLHAYAVAAAQLR